MAVKENRPRQGKEVDQVLRARSCSPNSFNPITTPSVSLKSLASAPMIDANNNEVVVLDALNDNGWYRCGSQICLRAIDIPGSPFSAVSTPWSAFAKPSIVGGPVTVFKPPENQCVLYAHFCSFPRSGFSNYRRFTEIIFEISVVDVAVANRRAVTRSTEIVVISAGVIGALVSGIVKGTFAVAPRLNSMPSVPGVQRPVLWPTTACRPASFNDRTNLEETGAVS